MTLPDSKKASLQKHIDRVERRMSGLRTLDARFSWARLIIFIAGVVVSFGLFTVSLLAGWLSVIVFIAVFSFVVSQHRTVRRTITQFQTWQAIKRTNIARLEVDWAKLPSALPPLADYDHPFQNDLDLTGERSLHHLLDTAVSLEGSRRLRDHLLTTPLEIATVTERQALVEELASLTYFRDRLTLDARIAVGSTQRRWEMRRLIAWFEKPADFSGLRQALQLSVFLAVCNIVLIALNQAGVLPPLWVVTMLAYLGLFVSQAQNLIELFGEAMTLYDVITPLVEISQRLEKSRRKDKVQLQQLLTPFQATDRPSTRVRRLTRLASAASLRNNPLVWLLLNVLIPWDMYVAYQLNRYRRDMAASVPTWVETWTGFEAASSVATFADLNSNYHFPDVNDKAVFEAKGLGHPLIPVSVRISNDFSVAHLGDVILITGSNMSGKSSFLRTLGINLCLAYAGGVVCADSFEAKLFRVFACIRVNDSLADGYSYFYAEVRRLRTLLSALETSDPLPLFFLIDEIFRATNNQERLIGSRAYLRALIGKHGVGAVSTHDLELTALPGLINYHFEDQVMGGEMTFDYRLRSGPSPTTNALKIMQLAGLPVEAPQS